MRVDFYDLDLTLLPFDSGMAWTGYLTLEGILPADAPERHLEAVRAYVRGELDVRGLNRAAVSLLPHPVGPELRARWQRGFEQHMRGLLPADAQGWIAESRAAGAEVVLITGTTRPIAEAVARAFGIEHVLASEPQYGPNGEWTDVIAGEPCFGPEKVLRAEGWLQQATGGRCQHLSQLAHSRMFSDSKSDLPLLQRVSEPVAVGPDEVLRAQAQQAGWRIIERGWIKPPGYATI